MVLEEPVTELLPVALPERVVLAVMEGVPLPVPQALPDTEPQALRLVEALRLGEGHAEAVPQPLGVSPLDVASAVPVAGKGVPLPLPQGVPLPLAERDSEGLPVGLWEVEAQALGLGVAPLLRLADAQALSDAVLRGEAEGEAVRQDEGVVEGEPLALPPPRPPKLPLGEGDAAPVAEGLLHVVALGTPLALPAALPLAEPPAGPEGVGAFDEGTGVSVAAQGMLALPVEEAEPPLGDRLALMRGEAEAELQPLPLGLAPSPVPLALRDAPPEGVAEGELLTDALRTSLREAAAEGDAVPQGEALREDEGQALSLGARLALALAEAQALGLRVGAGDAEARGEAEAEPLSVGVGVSEGATRTAASASSAGATASVTGRVRSVEKGSSAVPVALSRRALAVYSAPSMA